MGRPTALENGMTLDEELLATLRAWKQSSTAMNLYETMGRISVGGVKWEQISSKVAELALKSAPRSVRCEP
jgi:hypothetical protein